MAYLAKVQEGVRRAQVRVAAEGAIHHGVNDADSGRGRPFSLIGSVVMK